MRHRPRALLALTLLAAIPAAQADPVPVHVLPGAGAVLVVETTALRSRKGQVISCITRDEKLFPHCERDKSMRAARSPAGDLLVFRDLVPGRYALALFHDENGNGKLDKMMGLPREGFGFSRDAPIRFGPPSFDAAAFTVSGGENRIKVKLRYLM